MQIIETEHLTKYYGKTPVVDSLSLSVPEGSVYGFIGPNGAGKSTTMKMLLGLVKPNSGSIRLLGKSMTQQNRLSLLRQTGSLIESPACYGHLTGEENLQILAELKNAPEPEVLRALLRQSGLPDALLSDFFLDAPSPQAQKSIVLGYADAEPAQLEAALTALFTRLEAREAPV